MGIAGTGVLRCRFDHRVFDHRVLDLDRFLARWMSGRRATPGRSQQADSPSADATVHSPYFWSKGGALAFKSGYKSKAWW